MKTYEQIQDGHRYGEVEAATLAEAVARTEMPSAEHYEALEATIWGQWEVRLAEAPDCECECAPGTCGDCHPESEGGSVQIDPPAPRCGRYRAEADEHDWDDGPVYGSGGGVRYADTCRRCGVVRHTDTWATDPCTGEQGLTSVRYSLPEEEQWHAED